MKIVRLERLIDEGESLNKSINAGVLEIIVIEHDAISLDVPRITKGTDGRALV